MKKISVVYRNRENFPAIEYLKKNLESVFENYIQVNNYFLDELSDNAIIDGDIFLIFLEYMIYPLKKHIKNFNNAIVMNRGIDKKFISEISNIPSNTDVLVVNDSYESTIQTTNTFYELGISHINFIPYDKKLDNNNYYNDIEIAITPNEESLVPKFIKNIINIGYRQIGCDTLIKILQKLQLSHKSINSNIIRHMNNIVEPNATFKNNYLNSYLKSGMLDSVIFNSNEGILLTDYNYNLVYSNDKLNTIFNINDNYNGVNINSFIDDSIYNIISDNNFKNKFMKINDDNYNVEKETKTLMDQAIGYCITFKGEKDIRDLEINLKNNFIKNGLLAKYTFENIIHKSDIMKQCITLSKKAAITDYNILIRGESGTGKELIAQSIHNFSYRNKMPFVAINCAALPESLLESELFGYEGGSFTGARKNGKLGLFEQANAGTIFLDEIGDVSQNLQHQLLRVIQEKQIMRIGGDKLINVDIRIIAATNENLEEEVRKSNFRNDLFYRLNVIPIIIPTLKERSEDILFLLECFLGPLYNNLTENEKESVLKYDWPGNVRELESAANYYKTLDEFPSHIVIKKNIVFSKNIINNNIDLILKIINENTDSFHGIGRTQLIYELKNYGVSISDLKVRNILGLLKNKNYIEISRGRSGNRITQLGIDYLGSLYADVIHDVTILPI